MSSKTVDTGNNTEVLELVKRIVHEFQHGDTDTIKKTEPLELAKAVYSLLTITQALKESALEALGSTNTKEADDKIKQLTSYNTSNIDRVKQEIENQITNKYAHLLAKAFDSKQDTENFKTVLDQLLAAYTTLTIDEKKAIVDDIVGFGILTDLLDDDTIEEIQVNDYNDIVIIKNGVAISTDLSFVQPSLLKEFIDKLLNKANRGGQKNIGNLSAANPCVRLRLGVTRVTLFGGNIPKRDPALNNTLSESERAVSVYNMVLRKQKSSPITTDMMLGWGSISPYQLALLEACIAHGVSILGYGITGSGKTAMLRAIITKCVPKGLRIISIAETDEMNLREVDMEEYIDDGNGNKIKNERYGKPNLDVLPWEISNSKIKILGLDGFEGAVNASLTFTPELILMQETKGGEIKSLVEEALSGHQVITTIHVKSAIDVLARCLIMWQQNGDQTPAEMIFRQIVSAFPLLIEFRRFRDGSRKVSGIYEMTGYNSETYEPKIRPLSKFTISKNYVDPETGKREVKGSYEAICDPFGKDGKLLDVLVTNFLTDEEQENIKELYQRELNSNLLQEYNLQQQNGNEF